MASTASTTLNKDKIIAAIKALKFDDLGLLRDLLLTGNYADKRRFLSTQGKLGNIDFNSHTDDETVVSNTDIGEIISQAKEKFAVLIENQIKNSSDLNKLRAVALANSFPATPPPPLAAAAAAAAPPAAPPAALNMNGVRDVINDLIVDNILEHHTGNDDLLTNAAAKSAATAAENRIMEIFKEAINKIMRYDELTNIIGANGSDDAEKAEAIRKALNDIKAAFGNFEFENNPDENKAMLSDKFALELQKLAIQKRNEIVIINAMTESGYISSEVNFLGEIANSTNEVDTRQLINKYRGLLGSKDFAPNPNNINHDNLNEANIHAIKLAAKKLYNELAIDYKIKNCRVVAVLKAIANAETQGSLPEEEAIKKALDENKSQLGNIDPATYDQERLKEIKNLAKTKLALLLADPVQANFLKLESGVMTQESFVDSIVKDEKEAKDLTRAVEAAQLQGGTQVQASNLSKSQYSVYGLSKNEMIKSQVDLSDIDTNGKSIKNKVITLVQDHTGRVTDLKTEKGTLTDNELALKALKQAQMVLTNYKLGSGDIIIRGKDSGQASKVYAALLVLKKGHPELDKVKIVSYVEGACTPKNMPVQTWSGRFRISSPEDEFTKAMLPIDQSFTDKVDRLRKEVHKLFTTVSAHQSNKKNWDDCILSARQLLINEPSANKQKIMKIFTEKGIISSVGSSTYNSGQDVLNAVLKFYRENIDNLTHGKEMEADTDNDTEFKMKL